MQTEISKKYPLKGVPHRTAQTERGLQWFKTSLWLPDNSTTNSYSLKPNKGGWSYRRGAISNKQFLYKYWIARKVDNNATFTKGLPTKITFGDCMARAMIVLCQGFCYIKDIRIHIVIWIINNNVATEITCLQKDMVTLKNVTPSENLALLCPPLTVSSHPQLLKSSLQSHIFFSLLSFARERVHFVQHIYWCVCLRML